MTERAVFRNGRMFPKKGSPLFGVAAVTGFVDRLPDELIFAERAVRFVAGGAGHQAETNRMGRRFQAVDTLLKMTFETDRRLILRTKDRIALRVDRVTARAGKIVALVDTPVPAGTEISFVAFDASLVLEGDGCFSLRPKAEDLR